MMGASDERTVEAIVIRNVVMGRVDGDVDAEQAGQLEAGLAGIAGLDLPGQLSMSVGRDAGLRDGGWTFAIVNDWVDADAYRAYDAEAEHNRYRAMLGAVATQIARVQFELEQ